MQERPSPSPSASTTGYTRGSMECPMAWLASRSVESDACMPHTSPSLRTPKKSSPRSCLLRMAATEAAPSLSSEVDLLCSAVSLSGPRFIAQPFLRPRGRAAPPGPIVTPGTA